MKRRSIKTDELEAFKKAQKAKQSGCLHDYPITGLACSNCGKQVVFFRQ